MNRDPQRNLNRIVLQSAAVAHTRFKLWRRLAIRRLFTVLLWVLAGLAIIVAALALVAGLDWLGRS